MKLLKRMYCMCIELFGTQIHTLYKYVSESDLRLAHLLSDLLLFSTFISCNSRETSIQFLIYLSLTS